MPQYICKLPCDGVDYYLIWSTIVDAPITEGMTHEEFMEYYAAEYGRQGLEALPERMKRVEQSGCSDATDRRPVEEWIGGFNRAGPDESRLTFDEIVDTYIRKPRCGN